VRCFISSSFDGSELGKVTVLAHILVAVGRFVDEALAPLYSACHGPC
jgi:hypothetical protein